jgi:hypothetical protein
VAHDLPGKEMMERQLEIENLDFLIAYLEDMTRLTESERLQAMSLSVTGKNKTIRSFYTKVLSVLAQDAKDQENALAYVKERREELGEC